MPSFLKSLVDARIEAAREDGTLDRLPGSGKPLDLKGDPFDAMMDRMHKAAKTKPRAVSLKDQITAETARLAELVDPEARRAQMKILSDLQTRLAVEMEQLSRRR
ncbi:DUF1992 domain-containing protein [Salipiger sp. IMCC34102]|uniref:DnaJ family domain-containing protein n=1 Tax=Salipiger sp. IMCC34102 TaxID=2510647 RepID=UPI00101BBACF|nr:DnaJ family domain-containing protein [Salipiger sp. IMCC34102]RYH04024.1 DUF1992 domain-containing protein [Salipiger sp. IMCC34102]